MICKNCGKEIDDKSIYCEYCGAELAEPVILDQNSLEKVKKYEKEKKQKEKQNARELLKKQEEELRKKRKEEKNKQVPFYETSLSNNLCTIFALLAAVMMFMFPFLHWKYIWVNDGIEKNFLGFTLWDQCKQGKIAAIVFMIFLMLIGILMLYYAVHDNIKTIHVPEIKVKTSVHLLLRLIPIFVTILLTIVYMHLKVYKTTATHFYEIQLNYQSLVDVSKVFHPEKKGLFCRAGNGAAIWCMVLSILFYIFSQGFRFVLNTLNEEEDAD